MLAKMAYGTKLVEIMESLQIEMRKGNPKQICTWEAFLFADFYFFPETLSTEKTRGIDIVDSSTKALLLSVVSEINDSVTKTREPSVVSEINDPGTITKIVKILASDVTGVSKWTELYDALGVPMDFDTLKRGRYNGTLSAHQLFKDIIEAWRAEQGTLEKLCEALESIYCRDASQRIRAALNTK